MKTISAVAAIVLLFVVTVAAQTAVSIQQSQRQNAIALKRYEWKSLVQILKDGEIKSEQLAIVSFDRDGNLQTNVVTKTPEPKLPEHGLRGLIAKNKKKEAETDATATTIRLAPLQNVDPGKLLGAAVMEAAKGGHVGSIAITSELLAAINQK